MKSLKKLWAAAVLAWLLPIVVSAQVRNPSLYPPDVGLPGATTSEIPQFLQNIVIRILLPIAGIIAVMFIIIGGFQYIISGANEELAETAKKTLKNAIIGLVVIILSYAIVVVIINAFNRTP